MLASEGASHRPTHTLAVCGGAPPPPHPFRRMMPPNAAPPPGRRYHSALAVQPNCAEAHNNLGGRAAGWARGALCCWLAGWHSWPLSLCWFGETGCRPLAVPLLPPPSTAAAAAPATAGVLYRELGNMERTVQCYQAALNVRPNFPQVGAGRWWLGGCCWVGAGGLWWALSPTRAVRQPLPS